MSVIWQFKGNNRFLSNFYPAKVKFEGKTYPTAENAYQASKTLVPELRTQFQSVSPAVAKYLGGQVLLRPFFDQIKLDIMESVIIIKFQDEKLAKMLADTFPQKLVEGNTWGDRFWGMTYDPSEKKWKGNNHLGRILMAVRRTL